MDRNPRCPGCIVSRVNKTDEGRVEVVDYVNGTRHIASRAHNCWRSGASDTLTVRTMLCLALQSSFPLQVQDIPGLFMHSFASRSGIPDMFEPTSLSVLKCHLKTFRPVRWLLRRKPISDGCSIHGAQSTAFEATGGGQLSKFKAGPLCSTLSTCHPVEEVLHRSRTLHARVATSTPSQTKRPP